MKDYFILSFFHSFILSIPLVYHNLREGDLEAVVVQQQLHVPVQGPPGLEELILAGGHAEFQIHAAVGQLVHAHVADIAQVQVGMAVPAAGEDLPHEFFQLPQVRVIGYGADDDGQGVLPGSVLEVPDIGIVDHFEVAAVVLDHGGTDADAAHHAAHVVQDDDVAYAVLILKDNERTGDDILDEALGAETDDQAAPTTTTS